MLAANNAICMELQIFPPWLKKRREHRGQDTVVDLGSPAPSPPPPHFVDQNKAAKVIFYFTKRSKTLASRSGPPHLPKGLDLTSKAGEEQEIF